MKGCQVRIQQISADASAMPCGGGGFDVVDGMIRVDAVVYAPLSVGLPVAKNSTASMKFSSCRWETGRCEIDAKVLRLTDEEMQELQGWLKGVERRLTAEMESA